MEEGVGEQGGLRRGPGATGGGTQASLLAAWSLTGRSMAPGLVLTLTSSARFQRCS